MEIRGGRFKFEFCVVRPGGRTTLCKTALMGGGSLSPQFLHRPNWGSSHSTVERVDLGVDGCHVHLYSRNPLFKGLIGHHGRSSRLEGARPNHAVNVWAEARRWLQDEADLPLRIRYKPTAVAPYSA